MSFYSLLKNRNSVLVLLVILVVLTRLPKILHPSFYLDGDEAITGLSVLHFAQGKAFPGFFYGQQYGLVFFEALVAAPFVAIFGPTAEAIKLPMLIFFSLGLWFFWVFLQRQFNPKVAWLGVLFMLTLPAWYLWSMRIRGGYLPAFTIFNGLLLLLSFKEQYKHKVGYYFGIGFLVYTLYLCHALWFLCFSPLLLLLVSKKHWKKPVLSLALGSLISFLLWHFLIPTDNQTVVWKGPALILDLEETGFIKLLSYLMQGWSGEYYLYDLYQLRLSEKISSYLGVAFTFFSLILGISDIKNKTRWPQLILLSFTSLIAIFLLLTLMGPRYTLPLFQITLILFLFSQSKIGRIKDYVLVLFILLNSFSTATLSKARMYFRDHKVSTTKAVEHLADALKDEEIYHTYCLDPLFQWQINYLSGEEVIARWVNAKERYPPYVQQIDEALGSGKQTACIGVLTDWRLEWGAKTSQTQVVNIDSVYGYFVNPQKEWLKEAGFKFND